MKSPFKPETLPVKNIDWQSLISSLVAAHAEVARYDGLLESIPDAEILLSPLMTQEAVLSSKIEGTQATLEEVLEFEADPRITKGREADIEEVLNYRLSLSLAKDELKERPLCLNLIKRLHYTLLDGVRGRDKNRGEFRRTQNWIGKPGTPMEQAIYIPPPPDELLGCLSDWEKYCHYEEQDKLVQLAIIHAQFELIHPFLDGNGRIGRILIPIFLFDRKLLNSPVFYISAFFEKNRDEYYSRLLAISEENDWNGWIKYFLQAISHQAKDNIGRVKDIRKLYDEMKMVISQLTHSRFSIQVLDFLFHRPVFSSSVFISHSKIPKPSAARILKSLTDKSIIIQAVPSKGRKPAIYVFPGLLSIVQRNY